MYRFGWVEKGYKNILHFNITIIIISATMETVSTDIACEVSSEDGDNTLILSTRSTQQYSWT